MTKLEELYAAHQYLEYLWLCRDAGDTYSIGSGDDIIATSTSESLARFTVCAHNNMPALLEAVEFLQLLSPYLDDRQQPGEMWAAPGCRQILEKLK